MNYDANRRDKAVLRVVAGWELMPRPAAKDLRQLIRKGLVTRTTDDHGDMYELTGSGELAIRAISVYVIYNSGTFEEWSEPFETHESARHAVDTGEYEISEEGKDTNNTEIFRRYVKEGKYLGDNKSEAKRRRKSRSLQQLRRKDLGAN